MKPEAVMVLIGGLISTILLVLISLVVQMPPGPVIPQPTPYPNSWSYAPHP